jgi:integrase
VLRTALEALTLRLDGSRAAANTIIRKRAALHGALGYAADAGLLPDNPLDSIGWQVPRSSAALNPAVVASPAQVSALLDAVARTQPELTAFFGCLYYAALRPEEAVALRLADCHLPGSGWACSGWPRPRPGPPPPGPAAAPAVNSADSSGGRTG